jgi:nucleoside-diphosphate-sugar epimerase
VTGAGGYLGRHACRRLVARGHVVHGTVRPGSPNGAPEGVGRLPLDLLSDSGAVAAALGSTWDAVVHCAAEVPSHAGGYGDQEAARRSERMVHALLAVLPSGTPLIHVSSMTVYGQPTNLPWREQDAGEPESAYGRSKLQVEAVLRAGQCTTVALRLPGLFGGPRTAGLGFNLVQSLNSGRQPTLPPVPVVWAAVHVEDAANAVVRLVERMLSPGADKVPSFEAVHLAYDEPYAIDRFALQVAQRCGSALDYSVIHPVVRFDLRRAREMGLDTTGSLLDAALTPPGEHDARH